MTALYILGSIVVLIALICILPVSVEAAWTDGVFGFSARLWLFRVAPNEKKSGKKPKAPEKKKTEESIEKKPKKKPKLPSLDVIKMLLRHGFAMLLRIVTRIRVDELRIHIIAATGDPADTAMLYSAVGSAMEVLLAAGGDRIAYSDLLADVDFDGTEPVIDFQIRLSIRIGQVLGAAIRFGFGFLRDYLPYRRKKVKDG